ncbi:MAG: PilZ domain-containing protein [Nitrospirae bacterium]|nr:PilZ domain-containing protein [Nitrospirota bacterium]
MEHKSEKRSSGRQSFNRPVSFEICATKTSQSMDIQQNGLGVDISAEGIGLATDYDLRKGDILKLYLPINNVETRLPAYAEVMWSKPADENLRGGLRFLA